MSKADLWGQNPVLIYSCTYFLKIQASPHCSRVKLWDLRSCQQHGNLTHPGKPPNPTSPCALPALERSERWWERTAKQGCSKAGSIFLARPELTNWITQKAGGFPAFHGIHLHWPVYWHWLHDIPIAPLSVLNGPLYLTLHYHSHSAAQIFFLHERGRNCKNCSKVGWVRWDFITHKTKRTPNMNSKGKNFKHLSSVTLYSISMHNSNREVSLL